MKKLIGIVILLFILGSCKTTSTCATYAGYNKKHQKFVKSQQKRMADFSDCVKY